MLKDIDWTEAPSIAVPAESTTITFGCLHEAMASTNKRVESA